jgi:hypothetical protein
MRGNGLDRGGFALDHGDLLFARRSAAEHRERGDSARRRDPYAGDHAYHYGLVHGSTLLGSRRQSDVYRSGDP